MSPAGLLCSPDLSSIRKCEGVSRGVLVSKASESISLASILALFSVLAISCTYFFSNPFPVFVSSEGALYVMMTYDIDRYTATF